MGATIQIDIVFGDIKIITKTHPLPIFINLTTDEVAISEQILTEFEETVDREISVKNRVSRISLSMKDGSRMIDSSNKKSIDGKLVDDYICSVRNSKW